VVRIHRVHARREGSAGENTHNPTPHTHTHTHLVQELVRIGREEGHDALRGDHPSQPLHDPPSGRVRRVMCAFPCTLWTISQRSLSPCLDSPISLVVTRCSHFVQVGTVTYPSEQIPPVGAAPRSAGSIKNCPSPFPVQGLFLFPLTTARVGCLPSLVDCVWCCVSDGHVRSCRAPRSGGVWIWMRRFWRSKKKHNVQEAHR
jgi:hypothetical protein